MQQAPAAGTAQAELRSMDKVIIAIHGVGNQQRNETVRSVVSRFGSHSDSKVALLPLGYFYMEKVGEVKVSKLDVPASDTLAKIGFAEIFWADIPKKIDKESDTLEDIKAWGRTVVSQAESTYRKGLGSNARLKGVDFQLGAAVVDEIVETVAILENLLFLAEKMGLFKFDLAPVLREYVGDVQVVAEFRFFRDRILYRFHKTMHDVLRACNTGAQGSPELYIVAHSEGTVVSFLAMLQALSAGDKDVMQDPDDRDNRAKDIPCGWIQSVRGFMTIGSPIDKHLILWPQLWEGLDPARQPMREPIKWRNYYDKGDPIGFKLDTAVEFLRKQQCAAFDFESAPEKDDFGFSRYLMPGKAHVDYWNDDAVFDHFIQDVVLDKGSSVTPKDRPGAGKISTAIPYVLSAALHLAAVYFLLKALGVYFAEDPKKGMPLTMGFACAVISFAALLMGVTIAARVPRLVRENWRWWPAVWLAAGVPAVLYWAALPDAYRLALDNSLPWHGQPGGKLTLLLLAAALSVISGHLLRRDRRRGRISLILGGTLVVCVLVLLQIAASGGGNEIWPLLLAGAAFLYLWWLAILIFDLAFIWHRYIRESVALQVLRCWYQGKEAQPPKEPPATVPGGTEKPAEN